MSTTNITSLTVPAQLESVMRCTEFVAACATAAGFSFYSAREVELVVEEVVVNICKYAYEDAPGEMELCCTKPDSQHLLLEFIDNGRPFNILTLPAPDLTVDLDQRQVGGLGIPLVRAMAEAATYRREGNRNILRLSMQLPR